MLSIFCNCQAYRSVCHGCRNGVKADERLYSSLMEVAGQAQRVDLAFELQANMLAQGLQPSQVHTTPPPPPLLAFSHPSHSVCKNEQPYNPHTCIFANWSCLPASCPAHASPCPSPPPPPPQTSFLHASHLPLSSLHPLTHSSQPTFLTKFCPHSVHVCGCVQHSVRAL